MNEHEVLREIRKELAMNECYGEGQCLYIPLHQLTWKSSLFC